MQIKFLIVSARKRKREPAKDAGATVLQEATVLEISTSGLVIIWPSPSSITPTDGPTEEPTDEPTRGTYYYEAPSEGQTTNPTRSPTTEPSEGNTDDKDDDYFVGNKTAEPTSAPYRQIEIPSDSPTPLPGSPTLTPSTAVPSEMPTEMTGMPTVMLTGNPNRNPKPKPKPT